MSVTAAELLDALYANEEPDRRTRVNHARGVSAEGTFTAYPDAALLSDAVAFNGSPAHVLLRFSSSSGMPAIADADPRASPRGLALTVTPASGASSTFVGHSAEGFPASTPELFLAFLSAVRDPNALAAHLRDNPAARDFLARLPATPASFLSERFHFLHAYVLTRNSTRTVGRLLVAPVAAESGKPAAENPEENFLETELSARVDSAQARLRLLFQLAGAGDDPSDITRPWASSNHLIRLGEIRLDRMQADQSKSEARFYDPAELAPGIELVGDPMIRVRSEAYVLSHHRRSQP